MSDDWGLAQGTCRRTTPLHYRPITRTYLVHVPGNYDSSRAWPLVLVLHGAFNTAGQMERRSGFSRLADREGFVVAYPNGIGLFGFLQHWNAGHCCGLAKADAVDDVGFLCCVIDDVTRQYRIDPARIYVVGHSNGGMLAYEFARAQCRRIAGIAVVAGTIGSSGDTQERPETVGPPEAPVPLIAIHGWNDKTVPFEGGAMSFSSRHYVSVFDSVGTWARYCGCDSSPQIDVDPASERCILTWYDGAGEPFVELHILNRWPHTWPGKVFTEHLVPTNPLCGFDGTQVIWDFLRMHKRAVQ
jgi:polyhydroxybutyrate depolymerase